MRRILLGIARFFGLNKGKNAKRFGKYRSIVIDNKDPQPLGRLKVRLPSIPDDQITNWALPCFPYVTLSDQSEFVVPDIGTEVWIEFEEGDVSKPIWTGSSKPICCDPSESGDREKPINCKCSRFLECDETVGKEFIRLHHPRASEIILEPNGSVSMKDGAGSTIRMDAENHEIIVEDPNGNILTMNSTGSAIEDSNGNEITMNATGLKLKAPKIVLKGSKVHLGDTGGEPILKGQSFLEMFANHIHTSAPVVGGPSSPPIPQGENSTLSTTVKTI